LARFVLRAARVRSKLVLLAFAALVGCSPTPPPLDPQGRAMLDPIRLEALRPEALIAQLELRSADVVADVGAGPGFLTVPLARAVPSGHVIATDVRADYLAVASARAAEAGLRNVATRVVAPDRPGLDDRSVDVAVMCQVDHALADRAAYFARVARSLRPGGRIALVNYVRYRAPDEAAARAAGLKVVRTFSPSPPFFLLILAPEAAHDAL
jgi:SAM-dependent methyltransferase